MNFSFPGAILDKLLLFICCMTGLLYQFDSSAAVVAFLSAIILSCLTLCYPNRRMVLAEAFIMVLLCFWNTVFTCFLPLLIYDLAVIDIEIVVPLPVLLMLLLFPERQPVVLLTMIFFTVVACFMAFKSRRLAELNLRYLALRDDSHELNLLLQTQNKELMERQDTEVRMATLAERNRIAREIHDNVGHMLSRSILQVGALKTINQDALLRENLDALQLTLTDAMESIRSSVHNLHEDSIDLYESVISIIKSFPQYEITLDYDISDNVDKGIIYCFISTVKEALSNVVKHSNADKISIAMKEHPGLYQLLIEDNGNSCVSTGINGMGLANMEERVAILKGTIRFSSENGFRIFISVPRIKKGRENNEGSVD